MRSVSAAGLWAVMLTGCLDTQTVTNDVLTAVDGQSASATEFAALKAEVDALRGEVDRLNKLTDGIPETASLATVAQLPDVSLLEGRVDDLEGNLDGLQSYVDDNLSLVIATDTTWTIDGVGATDTTFSTLGDALGAADDYRIALGAVLTLSLTTSTTEAGPLEFDHRNGPRIHVIGRGPGITALTITGGDGIVVGAGSAVGLVADLSIVADPGDLSVGIRIEDNGALTLRDVSVEGAGRDGIVVGDGGVLRTQPGLVATSGNGRRGISVERGGSAEFVGPSTTEAGLEATNNGADGAAVTSMSGLVADYASLTNNGGAGLFVNTNSMALVRGATFDNNGSGVAASSGGVVIASQSSAQGNTATGAAVNWGGFLFLENAVIKGNGGTDVQASSFAGVIGKGADVGSIVPSTNRDAVYREF